MCERPRKTQLFIILSVLVLADIVASSIWFYSVSKTISQQTSDKSSDVAVVFFSDFGKGFGLDEEAMRRINHTVELYRGGLVANIICVGGARPKKNLYGAEYMKNALIALDVPANRLWSERVSNDSWSNWEAADKIIKSQGWNSVRLVSSGIHLYRLRRIASTDNPSIVLSPYSCTCKPKIGLLTLWEAIHHEWKASVANALLPKSVYRQAINWFRK